MLLVGRSSNETRRYDSTVTRMGTPLPGCSPSFPASALHTALLYIVALTFQMLMLLPTWLRYGSMTTLPFCFARNASKALKEPAIWAARRRKENSDTHTQVIPPIKKFSNQLSHHNRSNERSLLECGLPIPIDAVTPYSCENTVVYQK